MGFLLPLDAAPISRARSSPELGPPVSTPVATEGASDAEEMEVGPTAVVTADAALLPVLPVIQPGGPKASTLGVSSTGRDPKLKGNAGGGSPTGWGKRFERYKMGIRDGADLSCEPWIENSFLEYDNPHAWTGYFIVQVRPLGGNRSVFMDPMQVHGIPHAHPDVVVCVDTRRPRAAQATPAPMVVAAVRPDVPEDAIVVAHHLAR